MVRSVRVQKFRHKKSNINFIRLSSAKLLAASKWQFVRCVFCCLGEKLNPWTLLFSIRTKCTKTNYFLCLSCAGFYYRFRGLGREHKQSLMQAAADATREFNSQKLWNERHTKNMIFLTNKPNDVGFVSLFLSFFFHFEFFFAFVEKILFYFHRLSPL